MTNTNQDSALPEVLAEGKWLQRLALCLAHDHSDADDMVQETWLAALRASPDTRGSMRPWLGQVLRNARLKLWRQDSRRQRREIAASAVVAGEEVASTETMLARLELQRMISALVRDLDEPYRTTLLLRFFEDRTPADMARSLGVPAGTVRWRLNEGLRRVRAQLDEAHGGNRETWKAALLLPPLAAPTATASSAGASSVAPPATAAPVGASFGATVARLMGIALVPALAAGLLISRPRARPAGDRPADPPTATQARTEIVPAAARRAQDPRLSRSLRTVVPALISAVDSAAAANGSASLPVCEPGDPRCVQTIPRDQLPPAAEAALVRLLAGRTADKLRIEPKIRKGHMTYKARFEVDGVDEELDFLPDGTFIEQQVQLTAADLPGPVTDVATAAFPDGTIVKANLNNEGDVSFYELVDGVPRGPLQHRAANRWYGVRVRVSDQIHDLKITEDGKLKEDKLR